MSLTPPNPTACKGCGKPIVFEKDENGKWLQPSEFDIDTGEKLGKHDCPNYKPKPRQNTGGWTGTNRQGQMFEARESQDRINSELERAIDVFEKRMNAKLNDLIGLCREILITVKSKSTLDEELPEPIEEDKTSHERTDYGF